MGQLSVQPNIKFTILDKRMVDGSYSFKIRFYTRSSENKSMKPVLLLEAIIYEKTFAVCIFCIESLKRVAD